ncbi:MAG TPA: tetratricopeptide repeat protein [Spirochaetota bacterium]|nr:tetratricopeptide repeat protein [Spirochaetota bacterium]
MAIRTCRRISARGICFLFSCSVVLAVPGISAERNPRIGIRGGYTHLSGYYERKLNGGPTLGVYVIPLVWKYLMIECDSDFSYYPIRGAESSALISYSLGIGPHFYYSIDGRAALYAGTLLRGSVFHVEARETGANAASVKIGFSLSAGVLIPLPRGVELRIGYVFTENDLTRKLFMAHSAYLGVAYGFSSSRGVDSEAGDARETRDKYAMGVNFYNRGDFEKARSYFTKVVELDPDYPEARDRLDSVQAACDDFARAMELKKSGDYLRALKILRAIDPKMRAAADEREKIAGSLKARVPAMQEQGMSEYSRNDFGAAVDTFEKILLVDPENATAKLYLSRARKRHDAYRKLE